jgi:hypothetical protein
VPCRIHAAHDSFRPGRNAHVSAHHEGDASKHLLFGHVARAREQLANVFDQSRVHSPEFIPWNAERA